ncbi:LysR family transcriptional regulator [Pseudomonas palleroniana]|uniref:DNA-binding transcriptional regulator, LysR family n=1 Tax=Pseudomonas palleroniana TaxID=191390 RepID=A0A1H5MGI9_9PSED|nr:LysR family transcriptional regulator [Pseudomonas palleroniana]KAB0568026.1 LysR family transcriptional regulator [Pseudomonas palleroniana]PTC22927.1 LysR family transcriptional regulator [Pseudomonas palleroniana]UOP11838.1 LysR family transcriptional regulator [Pseudomonas palleroniana]SEE88446.1 DNA-binding transcriptional regulator, LysR family [Pseudomonas palleroniana]
MMNLMHWRLLVAVADHGSITAAAQCVGMTQSAASQAMAGMEATLGAQLFTREPRKTLPTALGLSVIEQARVMMGALQAIRSTVDEARPMLRGTLRIASFPIVLQTFLSPLLQRFKQLYPGIEVTTLEVTDDEVNTLLDAGLIDLGVVLNPKPERKATVLGRDHWTAVVPAQHALAQRPAGAVVTLEELLEQPFVLATGGCTVNAGSLSAEAGLALRDARVEVREWSSAFSLVREGIGVTLVPEMTLPAQRQGLRVMPLKAPVQREFCLVGPPNREPGAAAQALLNMLVN